MARSAHICFLWPTGWAGTERASGLAVAAIEQFTLKSFRWFFGSDSSDAERVLTQFQAAIRHADARILEEAADHEMLAMDIEHSGTLFVTAGRDGVLKVWHYDNGEAIATGKGHSEAINAVKISQDRKEVVTVCSEGAIMIWDMSECMQLTRG